MDLDAPIPALIFANRPLKLPYIRSVTLVTIGTILAFFLVAHNSSNPISPSRTVDLEFVYPRPLWKKADTLAPQLFQAL
jgi:hypothetical protein